MTSCPEPPRHGLAEDLTTGRATKQDCGTLTSTRGQGKLTACRAGLPGSAPVRNAAKTALPD